MGYSESGVEVSEILLYNFNRSKKPVKIHDYVSRIDIWQSVFTHTLTARFYLVEGIDLMSVFPIVGEEEIELSIKTDADSPEQKYTFFVDSIVDKNIDEQGLKSRYILHCVTKDFVKNSFSLYTKRYKDLGYTDSVASVLSGELKTKKLLYTQEATNGFFDYMVNRVRPFQTIDIIKERAVSAKYKSSLFYFFEDYQGYHFTTLENLVDTRSKDISDKQYFWDSANRINAKSMNMHNVLDCRIITQGDNIEKIRAGGLRNEVRQFDIKYGDFWEVTKYNNPSDYTSFQTVDDTKNDFNSPDFQNFVTEKPAVREFLVKDSLRPDMMHNETMPFKIPYHRKIVQLDMKLRIYGNTKIKLGDVISFTIPSLSGHSGQKLETEYISKNFLITELRHELENDLATGWSHYMHLDCRKTNLIGVI